MQKNGSNLVVKTVCELNIQVKSYCEKTSVKNHVFTLSLSSSPTHAADAAGSECAWGPSACSGRAVGPAGSHQPSGAGSWLKLAGASVSYWKPCIYIGRVFSTFACSYSHHQYIIVCMSAYLFITLSMFIYLF